MAESYYKLLRLCGLDDKVISRESPRIDKAFLKLHLEPGDLESAVEWVRQNHDVGLIGVRKLLGAWFKELIDLVLAREEGKTIVYYGFPSIQGPGMAISLASENIYCSCPDVVLCYTLGQIFNRLGGILEAGELNGLPAGHGLCSLQQIRVGGMAKGIIPVPDLVLTSSYYCDMGSKTDELLHQKYGHPAVYIDGCMDSKWGEYPHYLPQRVEFLGAQLNKLFDSVKNLLGVEVTLAAWDKAMSVSRRLYKGIGRFSQLMKADPLPVSQAEVGLAMWLSSGSTFRAITDGPEAVAILTAETEERVSKGIGVVEKGAPRIITLIHHYSDPRITHMIEKAGLAYAGTAMSSPPPRGNPETSYTTLGERIAEREMRLGFYHSAYGMAKRCEQAVKDLAIDGFIWNYVYNCRPLAQPSHSLKRWVEQQAGVPTLALETDNYDSRAYSAEALRTRVEAFAEMLRARKACGSI